MPPFSGCGFTALQTTRFDTMNEDEPFEIADESMEDSMDEDVLDVIPGLDWLNSTPPKPINLSGLDWPTIAAILVVATTFLALDFAAFRAAELRKRRSGDGGDGSDDNSNKKEPSAASKQQRQEDHGHDNDHDEYARNTAAGKGGGATTGGATTTVVSVQPGRASSSASHATESRAHRRRACILAGWIVGALVCHRMGLMVLARLSAIVGSFVGCLPHLLRSSKYRADESLGCLLEAGDKRRPVTDMLVWTSLVYCLPTVYGLFVHQYGIAALQLMTTIGSTLFHLTRETKFFNLDNVFATSLLSTTAWGFFLAVKHQIWWYVAVVGLGGPLAIFCILRCGMPGLVCRHPTGHGLCRRSNPEYDFFHMLWHLSSGVGTLVSIHYFEVNFPAEEAGGGWFYYFPDVPVVPTVALAVGALINFYGNHVGVMPLE